MQADMDSLVLRSPLPPTEDEVINILKNSNQLQVESNQARVESIKSTRESTFRLYEHHCSDNIYCSSFADVSSTYLLSSQ